MVEVTATPRPCVGRDVAKAASRVITLQRSSRAKDSETLKTEPPRCPR
jgi:hypothetical protein